MTYYELENWVYEKFKDIKLTKLSMTIFKGLENDITRKSINYGQDKELCISNRKGSIWFKNIEVDEAKIIIGALLK